MIRLPVTELWSAEVGEVMNLTSSKIYKPRIPDIAESVFDILYLVFDLLAGIIFLLKADGKVLFILYALLTFVLCGGDAFHLVPRIIRALRGNSEQIKRWLGTGLQVSSVIMTVFYVILLYIWKFTFPGLKAPAALVAIIWITAIVRIVICMFPQNDWRGEGNLKLSVASNAVFTLTGIAGIVLYVISGNTCDYHMTRMAVAILISFACYMPVAFLSRKLPGIGILMIPKTCAYIWIIVMGLQLLYRQ